MRVLKPTGNNCIYGTIIEKGNSNNIKYYKFSDGTLIMTGTYNTGEITSGNVNGKTITFPIKFKDTSYYVGLTKSSGGSYGFAQISDAVIKSVSNFASVHWCPANASRVDPINYSWVAIGEWK